MKKLIAVLLTLTLVMGMLPMVWAAEKNAEVYDNATYEYVFKSQAHYISSDKDTEDVDGDNDKTDAHPWRTLSSGKHTVENTDPEVSDGWGFVNIKTATNYSTNTTNTHWSFVASKSKPPAYSPDGKAEGGVDILALELQIDKAGTFDADISFTAHKSSPNVEIFLAKKPENAEKLYFSYWKDAETGKVDNDEAADAINLFVNSLSPNVRLGAVKNLNSVGDHSLSRIKIEEKGRYFLILVPNGLPDNWEPTSSIYGYLQLNKFTLTEVVSDKVEELTYITTANSFDFSNVQQSSAGFGYGERTQSLRTGVGTNCSDILTWEKKTTKNKSGETVEPFSPMNLKITDPWAAVSWYGYNIWLDTSAVGNGFRMQYDKGSYANTSSCHFTLFKVRVPYAGEYKFSMKAKKDNEGVVPLIYFIPVTTEVTANAQTTTDSSSIYAKNEEAFALLSNQTPVGYFNFSTKEIPELDNKGTDEDGYTYIANVTAKTGGDYYVMIDPDGKDDDGDGVVNSLEFNSAVSSNRQDLYLLGIRLTPVTTTADAEAAAAEAEKAAIIGETGDPTASTANAGTSKTVQQLKAVLDGEASVVKSDVEVTDGYATVTADATDADGNTFMYWVKGLTSGDADKKVVSTSASYTFKPSTGNNMLIAVYQSKEAGDKKIAKIYNRNGQLLATKNASFNIKDLDTPSMPGYGDAIAWADGYGNEYAVGEDAEIAVDGEVVLVAKYKDAADTYKITVKHQDGDNEAKTVEIKEDVAYGTEVKLTATARFDKSGYNTFNYWINEDGEIVGLGKSYTFNAWEDCTITAVYKEYSPTAAADSFKKVLLSTIEGNTLMAEFIGFNNAAEKGVMIGTKMFSMTGDGNQFTINNDENAAAKAYVIDDDGKVYYSEEIPASAE
ncbi:MAG: hypothetical protein IJ299_03900 [Oscillospiraceae bacterium]|nr:hypothetical protein [Oscillospiraceae bacterium]